MSRFRIGEIVTIIPRTLPPKFEDMRPLKVISVKTEYFVEEYTLYDFLLGKNIILKTYELDFYYKYQDNFIDYLFYLIGEIRCLNEEETC